MEKHNGGGGVAYHLAGERGVSSACRRFRHFLFLDKLVDDATIAAYTS